MAELELFERDLPAGVACTFTLKADLKDLAGNTVGGQRKFDFSTGGPAIIESQPYDGTASIDENQIFILGLDAVARPKSIEEHAYCDASGINEKIGVRLVTGKQRDAILNARQSFIDRHLNVYFRARGIVWKARINLKRDRMDKLPIAVLQCKQTLPANTDVKLVWGMSITSDTGIATDQDQTLSFKTRPNFTASFTCRRVNPKAPCIPILPMNLELTAPVRMDIAKQVTLTAADGSVYHPSFSEDDVKSNMVDSLAFKGPFPEKTSFKLALPANFGDDAGRKLANQVNFPLTVGTDEQPPLVKFPARFGIVEAHGDRVLPVTVRNVEATLTGNIAETGRGNKNANAAVVKGTMLRVNDEQDNKIVEWMKHLKAKLTGNVDKDAKDNGNTKDAKAPTRAPWRGSTKNRISRLLHG